MAFQVRSITRLLSTSNDNAAYASQLELAGAAYASPLEFPGKTSFFVNMTTDASNVARRFKELAHYYARLFGEDEGEPTLRKRLQLDLFCF